MQRTIRYEPLWQDRDIRFDASNAELALRPGERSIETYIKIEDTKGNTGEMGRLMVTNLRLIWQSMAKPRINLTIGLNCITTITNRMMHTKLRGRNEALYMMTKVNGTRYEFIFNRLEPPGGSRDMVDLIGAICRAYVNTRLYRDLRLRSAILSAVDKQLKMLPSEQIYNNIQGVWNLSSDQGNLGTMYLTNIRVIWHANMNELFNISLPYVQIRNIKVRESKFGIALVIESSELSGGYVLGFRLDPVEKLNTIFEELSNLYIVHASSPDFGVHAYLTQTLFDGGAGGSGAELVTNDKLLEVLMAGVSSGAGVQERSNEPTNGSSLDSTVLSSMLPANAINDRQSNGNDDELISGESDETTGRAHSYGDPVAAYLAEGESEASGDDNKAHEWVYVPELGLAIEKIKAGFSMDSLWEVVENQ